MSVLRVNPTRMELTKLKKRLQMAHRGYKLMKDKRDELMKRFLELAGKNKELREKVELRMLEYYDSFIYAKSDMKPEILEEALIFPKQSLFLEISVNNIMSVEVPEFSFQNQEIDDLDIYPYGFAFTTAKLDNSMEFLAECLAPLLELAQVEKAVQLLSDEIEKTRRRVNALEYVLIPQLKETIKYITMKLEENERGNLIRLMKVKDMMLEQARLNKS